MQFRIPYLFLLTAILLEWKTCKAVSRQVFGSSESFYTCELFPNFKNTKHTKKECKGPDGQYQIWCIDDKSNECQDPIQV